jgi:hypothetical protein
MPTPLTLMASGTLGEINVGAQLAVAALLPLIGQLDLLLGAQFGLGQLKAELIAQLDAALNLTITAVNPLDSILVAIAGALAAIAGLQASLSAGIALPSINVSASLEVIASLQVRIGGIQALLDLSLGIRLQGLGVHSALAAALSVGPVACYAATGQQLSTLLGQIGSRDYQGEIGIAPFDTVDAVLLLSKAPGFYAGASVLFVMPPA